MSDTFEMSKGYYILVFCILVVIVNILFYLRGIMFAKFAIKSADKFNFQLLMVLLKSPMSWYDVTPSGRILARVTKDQDDIDIQLPSNFQSSVVMVLQLLSAILMVVIILPIFALPALVAVILYARILRHYMLTAREVKRIESSERAPVIGSLQETINGTYVIRAFKNQEFFTRKFLETQHSYVVAYTNMNTTQHWIGVVTDLFAAFLIAGASYFGVLSRDLNYTSNTGLIALAMTWSFQIATLVGFALKVISDTESIMNALQRMIQYIDYNPQEKDWDTCENLSEQQQKEVAEKRWPHSGNFEVQNITYQYRQNLPFVIKNVNF